MDSLKGYFLPWAPMSMDANGLLRVLQNTDTSTLDLLIRESIQNSLDAKKMVSFVGVDITTGKFETSNLGGFFPEIQNKLKEHYCDVSYDYIAIRDTNTEGLTGTIDYGNDGITYRPGNLHKLVYEIAKPQSATGSGGSFGYGKTIFFHIGIGMVIYYSHVSTFQGFEHRLAVSFVESTNVKKRILPNDAERGIAFWGDKNLKGNSIPITDIDLIEKILAVFNIEPYKDHKTGTTVIVPYFQSKALLENAKYNYLAEENDATYPFIFSCEEYLKFAMQKWYAVRLDNQQYHHKPYLEGSINGEIIRKSSFYPTFSILQDLYNQSFQRPYHKNTLEVNYGKGNAILGWFSYMECSPDDLKMNPPFNYHSPFELLKQKTSLGYLNALITYVRKPGMFVKHKDITGDISYIPVKNKDNIILSIFVLNSDLDLSSLNDPKILNLEEYVRQGEKADHMDWFDLAMYSRKYVNTIFSRTANILKDRYQSNNSQVKRTANSALSIKLANILLPSNFFGNAPTDGPRNPSGPSSPRRERQAKPRIEIVGTSLLSNTILTEFDVFIPNNTDSIDLELLINLDKDDMTISEWEDNIHTSSPMGIEKFKSVRYSYDGKNYDYLTELSQVNPVYSSTNALDIKLLLTRKLQTVYGVSVKKKRDLINRDISIRFKAECKLDNADMGFSFSIAGIDK